jgi:penicillin V acylase-like amidase (Ntn superfamily)
MSKSLTFDWHMINLRNYISLDPRNLLPVTIAGDTGMGALASAGGGTMVGRMRRREKKTQKAQAQEQRARRQEAAYAEKRGNYNRAYSACLEEGKGYTVK